MVTDNERKFIRLMLKLKIWHAYEHMRMVQIRTRKGTTFIFKWLRERQKVDTLKHAPCCAANNYHKMRLVFSGCTCGAVVRVKKLKD